MFVFAIITGFHYNDMKNSMTSKSGFDFGWKKMDSSDGKFEAYLIKFGKSYPTKEEYERRRKNFEETERQVRVHNEIEYGHHAGFKLGLNMFADWDFAELDGDKGDRMFRATL